MRSVKAVYVPSMKLRKSKKIIDTSGISLNFRTVTGSLT